LRYKKGVKYSDSHFEVFVNQFISMKWHGMLPSHFDGMLPSHFSYRI